MYDEENYISAKEQTRRNSEAFERLQEARELHPVVPKGRKIASSWWAQAWNHNLERYSSHSFRCDLGRRYLRCAAVIDFRIEDNAIKALVMDAEEAPFELNIHFDPIADEALSKLSSLASDQIDSLDQLLAGQFPKELKTLFYEEGLFPAPEEIHFDCNCLDWADLCRHAAAALYALSIQFDTDPALLFRLRGIDTAALIASAANEKADALLEQAAEHSSELPEDTDLSALFGICVAGADGTQGTDETNGTDAG